jgi:hypothetical protein
MKRVIMASLAAAALFGLSGCGDDNTDTAAFYAQQGHTITFSSLSTATQPATTGLTSMKLEAVVPAYVNFSSTGAPVSTNVRNISRSTVAMGSAFSKYTAANKPKIKLARYSSGNVVWGSETVAVKHVFINISSGSTSKVRFGGYASVRASYQFIQSLFPVTNAATLSTYNPRSGAVALFNQVTGQDGGNTIDALIKYISPLAPITIQ